MPETWKGKLVLFARLLQKELGKLPCALGRSHVQVPPVQSLTVEQSDHKSVHKSGCMPHSTCALASTDCNAATALYNPFPTFPFTGSLRPIYPLSDRRSVPESITHPNYARTKSGNPEYTFANRNTIVCLDKKQQKGMRKSCRLAREVLDAAARQLKPGVTTDYIDEVVHRECIKRDVSSVT